MIVEIVRDFSFLSLFLSLDHWILSLSIVDCFEGMNQEEIIAALRRELTVVSDQLRSARARIAQLEEERASFFQHDLRHDDPSGCSHLAATGLFPFRYVPPTDFLPQVFVAQFIDVLIVLDKYAQLYHKHHVGGGVGMHNAQGLDEACLRSRAELLEQKNAILEVAVQEKENTISALREQLLGVARRAPFASGPKDAYLSASSPSSSRRKLRQAPDGELEKQAEVAGRIHYVDFDGDGEDDGGTSRRLVRKRTAKNSEKRAVEQAELVSSGVPLVPLDVAKKYVDVHLGDKELLSPWKFMLPNAH